MRFWFKQTRRGASAREGRLAVAVQRARGHVVVQLDADVLVHGGAARDERERQRRVLLLQRFEFGCLVPRRGMGLMAPIIPFQSSPISNVPLK